MYVSQVIEQQPMQLATVTDIEGLLIALNRITWTAPLYNPDPQQLNAFPMSSLLTYMMMTPAGEAVFRNDAFNAALRQILKEWCIYLDSEASQSVLNEGSAPRAHHQDSIRTTV